MADFKDLTVNNRDVLAELDSLNSRKFKISTRSDERNTPTVPIDYLNSGSIGGG